MQYEERNFEEASRLKRESVFHLASGQLGVRGSFEEGAPEGALSIRGTYLNGFCENEAIRYNEKLCGFPEEKQQIVNLPDAQTIRITANGSLISCFGGKDLVQTLDMQNGVYRRSFAFEEGTGRLRITFTRLVSFVCQGIFAVECRIESDGFEGNLEIESGLNPDVCNYTDPSDPRVASGNGKMLKTVFSGYVGEHMAVISETKHSRRKVACVSAHDIPDMAASKPGAHGELSEKKTIFLSENSGFVFHKFSFYKEIQENSELQDAVSFLEQTKKQGFEELKKEQREYLDDFWKHSRVIVEGNEELQTQLDFCLYGMLSSAGRDGKTNVAAKGLSGEGYEGHYFWDSEIYIFPFFLMTEPKIAKALLEYRYLHLNDARKHAERMGHASGALYPWRTISGSECSSHYPSGSAQYHINGDIAHAFSSYWYATGDESFLEKTCELLVETARLWIDTGHWYEGQFRIDCVTGPDEYTCLVNNNYYTNSCAAENLLNAAGLCDELKKRGNFEALKAKLNLSEEEIAAFRNAGENMYFPHDEKLKIIAQDDSFLKKKRRNIEEIPKDKFPLLMNYHPVLINRYQILKQADSVLANHIYREEDLLTMKRSFEYYEAITTHDSSLSNCIYAIMSARLGDAERAERYFSRCVGTDTSDRNGNTRDGLHIANMGGVYRVLTAGFGGVKITDQGLSLFPILPEKIHKIQFPVYYMGRRLLVSAANNLCTVKLLSGEPLNVEVFGRNITVGAEETTVVRKVKGVVFDLDGVITDTASFHFKAWKKLADELGIEFNEELNENFKGVSRSKCLSLLLEWGKREVGEEEYARLLEKKNEIYCEYLDRLTPESVLPGIADTIRLLRKNGIRTVLFSVSKNTDRILRKLHLTGTFDAVVTGNDISYSKPHYEGYLLSAERIGMDPRLCAMVEDSVAGITGAKQVSMRTVAIMKNNEADADLCIPATENLCEAIQTMI